ncbi:MAG: hypothetical protein ACR2G7_12195 [Acidimicrobiales bacterium]
MELHGPRAPTEGWPGLLGAVIAGTVTAGIDAVAPTWVALILGVAAPVLVGFLFPGEGTWPLTAGLLLAPLLAAVARGSPLGLVVLTLPVAAGFTFVVVRIGQRWRLPGSTVDPEAHGRRVRLAIIVAVAAALIVPGTIADRRMSGDADARAQTSGERLRQALDLVEPGSVSPFDFPEVLRGPGLPRLRTGQMGATEVRVTAEVGAGWQQRCIRGVRRKGGSTTIEILPKGCGGNG